MSRDRPSGETLACGREAYGVGVAGAPDHRIARFVGDLHSNAFRFDAARNLDAAGGSRFPAAGADNLTDHAESGFV
jgi:hypothetical protein